MTGKSNSFLPASACQQIRSQPQEDSAAKHISQAALTLLDENVTGACFHCLPKYIEDRTTAISRHPKPMQTLEKHSGSNWRRLIYGSLTFALIAVAAFVRERGGIDKAEPILLVGFVGLALAFFTVFVADVIQQGIRGRGYTCSHCGKRRHIRPFRLSPECPCRSPLG